MTGLKLHPKTGAPLKTLENVRTVLDEWPAIRGRIELDTFHNQIITRARLPWQYDPDKTYKFPHEWTDADRAELNLAVEKILGFNAPNLIDTAFTACAAQNTYHPIKNYLNGLEWDGEPRLDTLFVDYLGAADTPYTRAVTRKAFTAAVARAMVPGSKYDNMLILAGPQGLGKSTLLDKMSKGWFNDSIRTFEGKEASELLQGVWLVEISELDAFRRTDVARIKQFLSLRTDRFRAAYGRHVKELPRCCVFFGTTNTKDFLQDRTGNRRFWPVDVGVVPVVKSVWTDLPDEIDQLWAEAKVRWQLGEPLYLSGELEEDAKVKQEEHREVSAREGLIMDFLGRQVPEDWQSWPLDRRRMFWAGSVQGDIKLVDRDRVCALEIWCEALDGRQKDMRYSDTAEINSILEAAAGWEKSTKAMRCGYCGVQRGFRKAL